MMMLIIFLWFGFMTKKQVWKVFILFKIVFVTSQDSA